MRSTHEVTIPIIDEGVNPLLDLAGLAIRFDRRPTVEPACGVVVETMAERSDFLDRETVL
ncbi:MAG: hypothetical protein ABEJ57_09270 [Halobacteriaceae archaeon]